MLKGKRSELGEGACCTKDERTGDGSKDVFLLGAAVGATTGACWKLGADFGEVALEGLACAGQLNIAEYVHKVKVGHDHRLQSANEGLQGGFPMPHRLACPRKVDAPLMLAQTDQAFGAR